MSEAMELKWSLPMCLFEEPCWVESINVDLVASIEELLDLSIERRSIGKGYYRLKVVYEDLVD